LGLVLGAVVVAVACSSPPVEEIPRTETVPEPPPPTAAPVLEDATPEEPPAPAEPETASEEPAQLTPPKLVNNPVREFSPVVADALDQYAGEIHVVIGARIDETGRVVAAGPKKAEPEGLDLARAVAMEMAAMVKGWTYAPATRGGVPVRSEVEVRFDLEGGQASR
jgi:hypothetical protein